MLSTCENHDDYVVVYMGRGCPVCRLEGELSAAERHTEEAEDEVASLRENLDAVRDERDRLSTMLEARAMDF